MNQLIHIECGRKFVHETYQHRFSLTVDYVDLGMTPINVLCLFSYEFGATCIYSLIDRINEIDVGMGLLNVDETEINTGRTCCGSGSKRHAYP